MVSIKISDDVLRKIVDVYSEYVAPLKTRDKYEKISRNGV